MIKTKSILLITSVVAALLSSGCANNPKLDENGQSAITIPLELRPASMTEVSDLEGKSSRLIIRTKRPIGPNRQEKEQILKRLQQSLDKELGKLSLSVVDRNLGNMLENEIDLAALYNKEAGRDNADAVLLLVIDDYHHKTSDSMKTSMLGTLKEGLLNSDSKAPQYADCRYETQFSGFLRIQTIPELTQLDQFEFSKKKKDSFEETNQRGCKRNNSKYIAELNQKLIDDVACRYKNKIANTLLPTGHVLAAETVGEAIVLDLSLGSQMGVKEGDTLRLYHELTDKHYAEVKVTKTTATQAQGHIKHLDENDTVYEGDFVRPYKLNIMSTLRMNCLF